MSVLEEHGERTLNVVDWEFNGGSMGSRLKGRKRKQESRLAAWRLPKLIVYSLLILGGLVTMLVLYYQSLNLPGSSPNQKEQPSSER